MKYILLIVSMICSIASYGMDSEEDYDSSENDTVKHYDITEIFPIMMESLKNNLTYKNDTKDPLVEKLNEKDQTNDPLFALPQVQAVLSEQLQPMIQVTFEKNKTSENIYFQAVIKPLFKKSSCNELPVKYGFTKKDYYENDSKIAFSFFKEYQQGGIVMVGDQSNFTNIQGKDLLTRLSQVKQYIKKAYDEDTPFSQFEKSHLQDKSEIFVEAENKNAEVEIGCWWKKGISFVGTELKQAIAKKIPTNNFKYAGFEFKKEVKEDSTSLVIKAILTKDLQEKNIEITN